MRAPELSLHPKQKYTKLLTGQQTELFHRKAVPCATVFQHDDLTGRNGIATGPAWWKDKVFRLACGLVKEKQYFNTPGLVGKNC